MQYLDKIRLLGVKEINKKIESFFQPSIQYYEYLTLKFPYRKSEGQTKYLHFDNANINLELWADEFGFIFEINILHFKNISFIDDLRMVEIEMGIPYFEYGQKNSENKIINFECKNLKISTTSNDLVIQFCSCSLEENKWIGYDKMYYGVNTNNVLTSIIYKDYGCIDLVIKA